MVCLICGQDLCKHAYTGSLPLTVFKRGFSLKVCLFDAEEKGERVFTEVSSDSYKSPSANMRDGIDRDV